MNQSRGVTATVCCTQTVEESSAINISDCPCPSSIEAALMRPRVTLQPAVPCVKSAFRKTMPGGGTGVAVGVGMGVGVRVTVARGVAMVTGVEAGEAVAVGGGASEGALMTGGAAGAVGVGGGGDGGVPVTLTPSIERGAPPAEACAVKVTRPRAHRRVQRRSLTARGTRRCRNH